MELANEFVSRKTLPEFFTKLGGRLTNLSLTSDRQSTAYNTMVRNLESLIKYLKADEQRMIKDISDHLFTKSYNDQFKGIVAALIKTREP